MSSNVLNWVKYFCTPKINYKFYFSINLLLGSELILVVTISTWFVPQSGIRSYNGLVVSNIIVLFHRGRLPTAGLKPGVSRIPAAQNCTLQIQLSEKYYGTDHRAREKTYEKNEPRSKFTTFCYKLSQLSLWIYVGIQFCFPINLNVKRFRNRFMYRVVRQSPHVIWTDAESICVFLQIQPILQKGPRSWSASHRWQRTFIWANPSG